MRWFTDEKTKVRYVLDLADRVLETDQTVIKDNDELWELLTNLASDVVLYPSWGLSAILGMVMGTLIRKFISKKRSKTRNQDNLTIEITKKQQQLYQKQKELLEKIADESNVKSEIIRQQQEKLAEIELMLKVMLKENEKLKKENEELKK